MDNPQPSPFDYSRAIDVISAPGTSLGLIVGDIMDHGFSQQTEEWHSSPEAQSLTQISENLVDVFSAMAEIYKDLKKHIILEDADTQGA